MADPAPINALVHIELTKPLTAFIEKISSGARILYEPTRIIRHAKAKREADLIGAEAQIEISEIQQRAIARFVEEEGIKQKNIEDIIARALPDISSAAEPQNMDDDWIAHFFDRCRLISDDHMQTLWARLLAGEANRAGSFSKRTIDFVSAMGKRDAELFEHICRYSWNGTVITPIILEEEEKFLTKYALPTDSIQYLDDIRLIKKDGFGYYTRLKPNEEIYFSYFGRNYSLKFVEREFGLQLGYVAFTDMGRELQAICKVSADFEYCEMIVQGWRKSNLIVIEI